MSLLIVMAGPRSSLGAGARLRTHMIASNPDGPLIGVRVVVCQVVVIISQ